ncbi:MAG: LamG domain-containing protein [Planctomycetes bacterium]|nr:LamG domain-containing protein [Planctomycetota bacterium]
MFDENSGTTATDSSGNNNVGTVMGDAQWVAGKVGGALAFDGVDDMVVVSQNAGLPIYNNGTDNVYSITMWVKGGPQNDMRIFSEGSTTSNTPLLNLGTMNSGQFATYIRPEAGTISNHPLSQADPFDDAWHHIAWVDDNGTATLYVDGHLDGGDFNYTRGTMALDTTSIGGILRAAPSHFFTGQIDEVRVYDRALSAGEALWLAGVTDPIDKPF